MYTYFITLHYRLYILIWTHLKRLYSCIAEIGVSQLSFHSSLDRADRRGARLEASTEIFLHLGRMWTASHNSCGAKPVHTRTLSMCICVVFLVFCHLWPCLVVFIWQGCCVWLYDQTIGIVGVLLWPKAVIVALWLQWWLTLLIYLLWSLCKKYQDPSKKCHLKCGYSSFGLGFQGPAFTSVGQHWHNQAFIESYLCCSISSWVLL